MSRTVALPPGSRGRASAADVLNSVYKGYRTYHEYSEKYQELKKHIEDYVDPETRNGRFITDTWQKSAEFAARITGNAGLVGVFTQYYKPHIEVLAKVANAAKRAELARADLYAAQAAIKKITITCDALLQKYELSKDPTLQSLDGWVMAMQWYRASLTTTKPVTISPEEASDVVRSWMAMRSLEHKAEAKLQDLLTNSYMLSVTASQMDSCIDAYEERKERIEADADRGNPLAAIVNESLNNSEQLDTLEVLADQANGANAKLRSLDLLIEDWADAIDRVHSGLRINELLLPSAVRASERWERGAQR